MGIWIARNLDGTLEAYKVKPVRKKLRFESLLNDWIDYLDDDLYSEVTWDNSPRELVVKKGR